MKHKLSVLRAAVTAITIITFTAAQGNTSMVTNIPKKICNECCNKEETLNGKNPVYKKKANRRKNNGIHEKID